ncbi:hypothetical protein FOZ61_008493, partial [Perkinsus olseni]
KANMNAWEVFLHYQRADAALGDLIDDMESDVARRFAEFMRKRLRKRVPSMTAAQEAQVHDFRLINPESEAAGYPATGSVFSKKLVTRAARSHWETHCRHYNCSEETFVKAFKKVNRRLAKKAHTRNIFDERTLLAIELKETPDDPNLIIYNLVLQIEAAVSVDSCDPERGFSALQRIRSKARNRLKGEHLDAAMSLSINSARPSADDVVKTWSSIKPRRKKVTAGRVTKRDREGLPVATSHEEDDFVYDDAPAEARGADEDSSDDEEREYMLMVQSGYLVTEESEDDE